MKEEIRRLIREGKVEFEEPDAVDAMLKNLSEGGEPDFTVTKAELSNCWNEGDSFGFAVNWATKSAGFGSVAFFARGNESVKIESEGMSKDFIKEVLAKLVDSLDLDE